MQLRKRWTGCNLVFSPDPCHVSLNDNLAAEMKPDTLTNHQ